jgi:hypothetical protein
LCDASSEGTNLCTLLLLLIKQAMRLLGLCSSLLALVATRPAAAYITNNNTAQTNNIHTNTSTTSILDAPQVSAALNSALQYC